MYSVIKENFVLQLLIKTMLQSIHFLTEVYI